MNFIIILIIIILLLVVIGIFKLRKSVSLVKENSVKFDKLKTLNDSYEFNNNVKKSIDVIYYVKTKTELAKINMNNLILEMLSDNTNNITINLELTMKNEKQYENYIKRYNDINDETSAEIISTTNLKNKTFLFLENKVFKSNKENPLTSTKVRILVKYDDLRAKNKYEKSKEFSYNDLKKFYEEK